jgi:hypothetical protein
MFREALAMLARDFYRVAHLCRLYKVWLPPGQLIR